MVLCDTRYHSLDIYLHKKLLGGELVLSKINHHQSQKSKRHQNQSQWKTQPKKTSQHSHT